MRKSWMKTAAVFLSMAMMLGGCADPTETETKAQTETQAQTEAKAQTEAATEGESKEEGTKTESTGTKTVTMAMTSAWDTLIPFNTTSASSDAVIELIFDKLIVVKADGSFGPRLAKEWSIDDETHTKITFVLDENAKWHDGTPVTADDVVFTAEVMANPDINVVRRSKIAPFTGMIDGKRDESQEFGVKKIDDHTVEFTMIKATPLDYMLDIMFRDFYVIPKHLLKDVSAEDMLTCDFWKAPVGSGPCIYEDEIAGERISFKANKDYHLQTPDFDRLVVKVVASSNLLSGLMNGEIDLVAGGGTILSNNDWEMAGQQENLVTESVPSLSYTYMSVNTKRFPQEVRQAINMAINRDALVNNLMRGEGISAPGPLAPNHPYFNEELLPIPYDPETAKQMVADSGFDISKTYQLNITAGSELVQKAAPMLQQDLAKIGLNIEIVSTDFATLLSNARKGEYDFCIISSGGSPDPGESVMNVTPGHINNFSQNEDPSLGEKGAEGLAAFTYEERKPYYDEYQMMLREQSPFVFLYLKNDLVAYNKRLSNIHFEDFSLLSRSVWEWKVED